MSEKEKVLGICLAKLQDRVRTEYLNAINRAAALEGWKTVAYNSFRDFRKNDRSLQGSKSIYKIINYDEVDVVIVFPESINNSSVSDSLIESARAAGKPVSSFCVIRYFSSIRCPVSVSCTDREISSKVRGIVPRSVG